MRLRHDTQKFVCEVDLADAFHNTNFGVNTLAQWRKLMNIAVLKRSVGYHCGHTITQITIELGLCGRAHPHIPTKKGRQLLQHLLSEVTANGP